MSKFIKKLRQISESATPPLGFRTASVSPARPMLLIASLIQDDANIATQFVKAEVDAVLIHSKDLRKEIKSLQQTVDSLGDIPLGMWLESITELDATELKEMGIDFLPLEAALHAVDRIRPGSIVMTVREDRSWVPLWITHLGFTVPADEPTLRHASRMKSALVSRDHSLSWYLEHLGTYKNWKAAGIAVFEPVEFGPRLSLLPPPETGNPAPALL